jgi:hypothetical protein
VDREQLVNAAAVVLMIAGGVMLLFDTGGVLPFAFVAIGIALVVILEVRERGREPGD